MQANDAPANSATVGSQPPEPVESLVSQAERIVTGQIQEANAGDYELVVREVLAGPAEVGQRIRVMNAPKGARALALFDEEEGVWLLGAGDPAPVLAGGSGGPSQRTVERVMAGLPAVESPPSDQELQELAAESDVVVWAEVTSTDGTTASARRLKVLQGDIAETFTVTAGGPTDAPGGPWTFPVRDVPDRPVLFLKQNNGGWTAINPTDVTLYRPTLVERALSYQATP